MARPPVDLSSLTADVAAPMTEATQRIPAKTVSVLPAPEASEASSRPTAARKAKAGQGAEAHVGTANLEPLNFKVSPAFRKRFRQCAVDADMKLNELLFSALDAWEKQTAKKH